MKDDTAYTKFAIDIQQHFVRIKKPKLFPYVYYRVKN